MMNKELFSFLFVFISLVVGSLYYTNTIQAPFLDTTSFLKKQYHQTIDIIQSGFNKHLYQAQEIENLTHKLQRYDENNLLMLQISSNLNDLLQTSNSSIKNNPDIELVRTLSYQKFGDFNKIWLDIPDYNASKIYGLVYQNIVAGIVVPKNERPLALLNKDIKSTYAVSIGSQNAPGIAQGNNGENIVVKYIPAWLNIKENDAVTSSGLDQLFFKGLKVGRVISVKKSQGFQTAIVKPYFTLNNPSYFYIIRSVR